MEAKFILSKEKVVEQYKKLEDLGLKVSYSYKTNKIVGNVLQDLTDSYFSIHLIEEIEEISDKSKIWFFSQAWNEEQIEKILDKGVNKFVIDNEEDLVILLELIGRLERKV